MFCYAKKYNEMLNDGFAELEMSSKSKKNSVLKAFVALWMEKPLKGKL